jgi:ABC-type amino acid transport substrate-binding protein
LICNVNLLSKPYYAFFKNKDVADAFDKGFERILKNGTYLKILKKYDLKNNLDQ